MNIQSEIEFFADLAVVDKARFLLRVIQEIAEEAKATSGAAGASGSQGAAGAAAPAGSANSGGSAGAAGDAPDAAGLRFANEMVQRLARFAYQLLAEDTARPQDEVVVRMLLGARADKRAERIVQNAYRRVLHSFESFDTTVLLNSQH